LIDQGAKIVEQTGAGLVVDDNVESISVALMRLVDSWRAGYLERITERHDELIAQHSWDERARLCLTAIALAVRRDGHERPPEQTA
jgi:homospermidine synthase